MMRKICLAVIVGLLTGCASVETARIAGPPVAPGRPFATTSDIDVPYESMGPIQATRRGVILFGHVDPVGFDLQACIDETLMPEVRRIGADGVINLRFEQTQLTPAGRIAGAILFFVPFPAEVTVRGEAVRLKEVQR